MVRPTISNYVQLPQTRLSTTHESALEKGVQRLAKDFADQTINQTNFYENDVGLGYRRRHTRGFVGQSTSKMLLEDNEAWDDLVSRARKLLETESALDFETIRSLLRTRENHPIQTWPLMIIGAEAGLNPVRFIKEQNASRDEDTEESWRRISDPYGAYFESLVNWFDSNAHIIGLGPKAAIGTIEEIRGNSIQHWAVCSANPLDARSKYIHFPHLSFVAVEPVTRISWVTVLHYNARAVIRGDMTCYPLEGILRGRPRFLINPMRSLRASIGNLPENLLASPRRKFQNGSIQQISPVEQLIVTTENLKSLIGQHPELRDSARKRLSGILSPPDSQDSREGFVQLREAARRVGVSSITVLRAIANGKLPTHEISIGRKLVRLTDCLALWPTPGCVKPGRPKKLK